MFIVIRLLEEGARENLVFVLESGIWGKGGKQLGWFGFVDSPTQISFKDLRNCHDPVCFQCD
jgi:hypothetical protein